MSYEDIKNLRNQFDTESNNPIAIICDYLIQRDEPTPQANDEIEIEDSE